MSGSLFVLGLSWRTAPVELRERVAFRDEELEARLAELVGTPVIGEACVLSTCNRVEIYGATKRGVPPAAVTAAAAEARRYFAASRGLSSEELSESLYEHVDVDAVRHVFRVASALDSMVVGEAQILGQLKAAYGVAAKAGTSGPMLGRCMERAFGVAKRVRSETGIALGAANVSSVAVDLARRVFGDLYGKTVMVIGAGKMSDLAARHLRSAGAGAVLVTNRSPDKAAEVAKRVDGTARPWDQLADTLAISDVAITSTGAKEPILDKRLMKSVMRKRKYRPLVIIDIAVPRDADPRVGDVDGVYLFDIDDLERVVAENLKARSREAEDAIRIVEAEVAEFHRWMRSQSVVPTIRALREHFLEVARGEADKVAAALRDDQSPEERAQAVRRLGELIANKLLHKPMTALKRGDEAEALIEATQSLFELDLAGPAEEPQAAPQASPGPSPSTTKKENIA